MWSSSCVAPAAAPTHTNLYIYILVLLYIYEYTERCRPSSRIDGRTTQTAHSRIKKIRDGSTYHGVQTAACRHTTMSDHSSLILCSLQEKIAENIPQSPISKVGSAVPVFFVCLIFFLIKFSTAVQNKKYSEVQVASHQPACISLIGNNKPQISLQ